MVLVFRGTHGGRGLEFGAFFPFFLSPFCDGFFFDAGNDDDDDDDRTSGMSIHFARAGTLESAAFLSFLFYVFPFLLSIKAV